MSNGGFEIMYDPGTVHKCDVPSRPRTGTVISCKDCGTLWVYRDSIFYEGPIWRQVRWHYFKTRKALRG